MSAIHDISLRRGNTFRRRFRLRDLNGPLNLNGSVLTLTIGDRQRPLRLSTRDGSLAVLSAIGGELEAHLTAAATRELAVGVMPYELERQILDERTGEWDEATILSGFVLVDLGLNDER